MTLTRLPTLLTALSTALLLGGPSAAAAPRLSLASLDTPTTTTTLAQLRGSARVVVFWRTDCAPCLIELPMLEQLQGKLGLGRIVLVGLDDGDAERRVLAQRAPDLHGAWAATGDAAAILTAFGGPPPRLPLAVAIDRSGRICARHHGLLGSERIESWIRQCSA